VDSGVSGSQKSQTMYNDDDELQQLDYTKLRYALYVHKSTDDESKQLCSLEDQIAECEVLAKRFGIRLVKPYLREKKSAKIPNNRPVFTQMLRHIRHGMAFVLSKHFSDDLSQSELFRFVYTLLSSLVGASGRIRILPIFCNTFSRTNRRPGSAETE
jgi:hypothetical protein